MSFIDSGKDTTSSDLLAEVMQHILSNQAGKTGGNNFTVTNIIPLSDGVDLSDVVTATAKTLGDYMVVDNSSALIAFLPMDYDVLDASNSNDGTVTGNTTFTDGPEISSTHSMRKAFSLDGSSYITLANESNFDFDYDDTFSVAFWVKMASISADQGLIMKSNDLTTGIGWGIYFNNTGDTISFKLADGTTAYTVTSSTAFTTSKYNHIVVTYDGSSNRSGMKIYVNGALETTGTSSAISNPITNNSSVVIGAESDAGSKLTAYIDDVQIWNTTLGTSDITDLFSGKQINFIPGYGDLTTLAGVELTTLSGVTLTTLHGVLKPAVVGFSDVT